MYETGKNCKESLGLKRFASIFVFVWTILFMATFVSEAGVVAKIAQSERIKVKELQKTVPKKTDDILSGVRPGGIIKISAALTVEPYVIKVKDSESKASGFEVEIVREALALQGYDVQFVYEPLKRTKFSFLHNRVGGVMDVKDHYPEIQGSFLSDEYITYHNTVITLQSNNVQINAIADMTDKSVIGFQQAKIAFGSEFKAMAENNPSYSEMANQKNQIAMLFLNRVEVIVLDHHIFKYYRIRLKNIPVKQPVTFHELFEPSSYRIAFRDSKVRDSFNLGIKKIKKSGRYREIIDSYIEK